MKISKFGILFLLLALRIDKHIKGYVDFYFGPENLRKIVSKENIKNQIKRISNPVYSKNAFMYNLGSNLIKHKYGGSPSVKNFRYLLVNPILPSDLI